MLYEIVVERHRRAATVVTSNREPIEWLGLTADPLRRQGTRARFVSLHARYLERQAQRRLEAGA
ncbi:MAG: hypothetical protein ACLGIO_03825 [Acidimicrobiia bacterium]